MRVLIDELTGTSGTVGDDQLAALYAAPRTPWLRVNMVATVDGAATGADGRSGGINNAVDKRVFDVLRELADALVVGAGTVRVEGYGPTAKPLVVVTRSGKLSETLLDAAPGALLAATCAEAPGRAKLVEQLGSGQVLVCGQGEVDLLQLKDALAERGLVDLLSEGGPTLLRSLVAAGAADELTLTTVPRIIAGRHRRITVGEPLEAAADPKVLLTEDGTLLGRWFLS